jgi:hypothetical protein
MKIIIFLFALFLSSCASRVLVKECELIDQDIWTCKEI